MCEEPNIDVLQDNANEMLSLRLREKASIIIEAFGRPLTVKEIEAFLQSCEPDLFKSVKSKCEQYIRIILGNTKNGTFIKYKSKIPIQGIDKRTIFFGLNRFSEMYSPSEWLELNEPTQNKKKNRLEEDGGSTQENDIRKINKMTYDERTAIEIQKRINRAIKNSATYDAWNNLTSKISPKSQLWPELLSAINYIANTYKTGVLHPNLLNELMMTYPTFIDPDVSADVRSILLKEIILWNNIQLALVI